MLFSRFAQSAAALVLLTAGFTAPVQAQANKPIVSGTWYEDQAHASNSGNNELLLTFAQTPTGQFLNITNVACTVEVAASQSMSTMILLAGDSTGNDDLGRRQPIKGNTIPETVGSSKFYSVVNNQIYFKFGPGRYPSIRIDTLSSGTYSIQVDCVLVGNLTDN